MNIKLIFTSVLILFVSSTWAEGQEAGQRTGRLGQSSGQSKQINAHKPSNKNHSPYKNNNVDHFDKHNSSHKKYYEKNPGISYNNYKHGKHYKSYNLYYYPNNYGYIPYRDYYVYSDPLYPYGYGTTLGTVLERPSNLDVNQYNNSPNRESYDQYYQYDDEPSPEYYTLSPGDKQLIYIWVDENGVENYVNDLELVPLEYRNDVRIMGREQ